jgi:hypothetical protein
MIRIQSTLLVYLAFGTGCGERTLLEKCDAMGEELNACGIEVLYSDEADQYCADLAEQQGCVGELDAALACLEDSDGCCDPEWNAWDACVFPGPA